MKRNLNEYRVELIAKESNITYYYYYVMYKYVTSMSRGSALVRLLQFTSYLC